MMRLAIALLTITALYPLVRPLLVPITPSFSGSVKQRENMSSLSEASGKVDILYSSIEKTFINNSTTIFTTAGYYKAGDLGRGMPMSVGTASGPLARRSVDGRWWNVDLEQLPDIPLGFCGAVADDRTDNTASAQTCAAVANLSGKLLRIRTGGGIFRIGSSGIVKINTGVVGDGKTLSYVRNMSEKNNLFYCSTRGTPHFVGVHYLPKPPPSSETGATIYLDAPSGGYTFNAEIAQNAFQGQSFDVYCNRCNVPNIHDNFSTDYKRASIVLDNIDNTDNGDQHVYANVLDAGSNDSAVGVLQFAAGGLIMTGNKVGNGASAYRLQLRKGVSSSILKISNNSFENQKESSILLTKDGAQDGSAGVFLYADVSDNEIATSSSSANISIDGGAWLNGVRVSSNIINIGSQVGIGIAFNGGLVVDAENNMFLGYGGATAISVAATVTGRLGPQTVVGTPTLCICRSMMISYDGLALVKTSPSPSTPFSSPEVANKPGSNSLASFSYTAVSDYGSAVIAELEASGYIAGLGESAAHQKLLGVGKTLPFFEQLVSKTATANHRKAAGFEFSAVRDLGTITLFTSYDAAKSGSSFLVKMKIVSGSGIFKTL